MDKFEVTVEQQQKIDKWIKDVIYPAAIEKQKAERGDIPDPIVKSCWEAGYPYEGAIGGGVTYSFTPTSLGVVLVVSTAWSDETLNVTDYESW